VYPESRFVIFPSSAAVVSHPILSERGRERERERQKDREKRREGEREKKREREERERETAPSSFLPPLSIP
jgi:hypothetical protein